MTSLAGLAFMSSGSSPGRGPYGAQIDKALVYVMENTSPSGFIAVLASSTHGPMYSHGFGTLFLAEAYGMTHRPEIREKLQKAVRLIIDSQNNEGGWRYQPVRHDADLSVTICQINALRAARNAGLYVPKETVDACIRYVKQSQNPDGGFRYMLQAGATSEFPRSAAGVVAPAERRRIRFQGGPRRDRLSAPIQPGFAGRAGATTIISMANTMRPRRCGSRVARPGRNGIRRFATSCSSRQSASGYWTDNGVCNEYGTAMALIILQIPNNYLPIFQR